MPALITGLLIDLATQSFTALALQKQNYRDNEAFDGMIDIDMFTT